MAMALSLVAVTNSPIRIEEPEVVGKSFPGFWVSLANCGFETSVSE
jgi:5-enolpyruvylshikimate-3-phosphate synthase